MTPLITIAMASSTGPMGERDKNDDAKRTIMYGTRGASIASPAKVHVTKLTNDHSYESSSPVESQRNRSSKTKM